MMGGSFSDNSVQYIYPDNRHQGIKYFTFYGQIVWVGS